MLFSEGYPGFLRGFTPASGGGFFVTTSNGEVAHYRPADSASEVLAEGLDQLYGIAAAPGGALVVAELGAGRILSIESGKVEVLAEGVREPVGVTFGPGGACLVAESGAGRVIEVSGAGVETVLDGLQRPQGILVRDGKLCVVDADAKELIEYDLSSKTRKTIASGLPVGAPPGVTPKPLLGLPPFSGPQGPFAGITAAADGTLYVSADAEGSVLAIRPA
jgi:glucose/arabinose dehydrogenase